MSVSHQNLTMKLTRLLLPVFALCAAASVSFAQSPKIVVVDLGVLYDGHHKTVAFNQQMDEDEKTANAKIEELNTAGNALIAQYQEQLKVFESAESTEAQKDEATTKGQELVQQIQEKQQELAAVRQQSAQYFQGRIQAFRDELLQEITTVATEVAKEQGADFLFDKAGATMAGLPSLLYAKESHDITAAVAARIEDNKQTVSFPAP